MKLDVTFFLISKEVGGRNELFWWKSLAIKVAEAQRRDFSYINASLISLY